MLSYGTFPTFYSPTNVALRPKDSSKLKGYIKTKNIV